MSELGRTGVCATPAAQDRDVWPVAWRFGAMSVHAAGGMLGGVELGLEGRRVRPFYEAPWLGSPEPAQPDILNYLRSEFPCVPFGVPYPADTTEGAWRAALSQPVAEQDGPTDETDGLLHGYCAAAPWRLIERTEGGVTLAIDYPEDSIIKRLTRTVQADLAAPAIDFALTVEVRRAGRRPFGLHPNLALPAISGTLHLRPGAFKFGVVHPAGPEPGVSRAWPGAVFTDLADVPTRGGGSARFDRLPFAFDTEEIVQLCGIDGSIEIADQTLGATYRLSWDAAILPSLLLWISNRGRSYAPWNGRNLCVGVEPLVGAFDIGSGAALADNPINARGVPTAAKLDPDAPITLTYRFALV